MIKDIEKIFYKVIIGALILIIISLIIILLNNDIEIFKVSDSFWGSLIGAAITGVFAVYVMNSEWVKRRNEEIQRERNLYKKSFILIEMWHKAVTEGITSARNNLINSNKRFENFKQEVYGLKECLSNLNQINHDYIPTNVYKEFLEYKSSIEFVISLCSAVISSAHPVSNTIVIDEKFKNSVINQLEIIEKNMSGKFNKLKEY